MCRQALMEMLILRLLHRCCLWSPPPPPLLPQTPPSLLKLYKGLGYLCTITTLRMTKLCLWGFCSSAVLDVQCCTYIPFHAFVHHTFYMRMDPAYAVATSMLFLTLLDGNNSSDWSFCRAGYRTGYCWQIAVRLLLRDRRKAKRQLNDWAGYNIRWRSSWSAYNW